MYCVIMKSAHVCASLGSSVLSLLAPHPSRTSRTRPLEGPQASRTPPLCARPTPAGERPTVFMADLEHLLGVQSVTSYPGPVSYGADRFSQRVMFFLL